MDGSSPRIFQYSYSNSSLSHREDSVNLTHDLERSLTDPNAYYSPTLGSRANPPQDSHRPPSPIRSRNT